MERRKYCKNCGQPLEFDAKFCTECGTAVTAHAAALVQQNRSLENRETMQAVQGTEYRAYEPLPKGHEDVKPTVRQQALGDLRAASKTTEYGSSFDKPPKSASSAAEKNLQEEKKQIEEMKRKKKKTTIIVVSVIAVALAVLGIAAVVFNMGDNESEALRKGQLALQQKQYEEAIAAFEEVLKDKPQSIDAQLGMADAYIGMKEYSTAVSYLDEVLKIDSRNIGAYGRKGTVYSELGQTMELNKLVREAQSKRLDLSETYGLSIPAAPEIIVADDAYSSVSITTNERKSKIKYTLDGTEPTENSLTYEEALDNLSGDVTVKAMVVNEKGIYSDVTSQTLNLEGVNHGYDEQVVKFLGKTYRELTDQFGELKSVGSVDGGTLYATPDSRYVFSFEAEEPEDPSKCVTVDTEAQYFFTGFDSGTMTFAQAESALGSKGLQEDDTAVFEIGDTTVFIYDYDPSISVRSEVRCKATKDVRGE